MIARSVNRGGGHRKRKKYGDPIESPAARVNALPGGEPLASRKERREATSLSDCLPGK